MSEPNWSAIVRKSRQRWFVRRGPTTYFLRGFRNRHDADQWIWTHQLEWRVGFLFRIAGDTMDTEIVDRKGNRA
jgi:hypothetical protein